MNENLRNAIDFASSDNITDMQSSIELALQSKIADALEAKRIEVAQSFMQPTSESLDEYEIVKTKGGYVDDEGNFVSDKSGGKNWQRSWTNRKRPSGFSSALQPGARIYHDVPFKRKDEAKAEGMKFDGDKKKWYHTDSTRSHYSKFEKLKESVELEEKLSVSDGVSAWIKDFVHSDDPRFEGKSKEERRQMALGAFYSAKKQQNEELEDIQELNKDTLNRYINKAGISKNDNRDAAKSAEAAAFKMKDDRIGDWKSMKSQEDSHNRIVKNREKGIERAAKKLTKNEEVEEILEAKRLISTHGEGVHTAKVYKDPEYNEYQVHFFKNGKHMGEGPVSYHDDKDDAVSTAKHETTRMNSSVSESAPSAGLSAKEKSAVVKKAKAGKDIGKKGKGFEKVVAKAKKYGAKDPEAVAAAAMWKNIKR